MTRGIFRVLELSSTRKPCELESAENAAKALKLGGLGVCGREEAAPAIFLVWLPHPIRTSVVAKIQ